MIWVFNVWPSNLSLSIRQFVLVSEMYSLSFAREGKKIWNFEKMSLLHWNSSWSHKMFFADGWGLMSQRHDLSPPESSKGIARMWRDKGEKKTWVRPIASYVRCASQRDATNGMNALPAHSPSQSVVRPLSDVGETRTGREPERFCQSEAVSTVEKVWLVPRSSSQPAPN